MKSIFKSAIVIAGLAVFVSCNNSSSESSESKEDTSSSQSNNSMMDTSSGKKDQMNMSGSNMMSSMNATMDRMKQMKMTGDFDIDFANMMIEHHQGGIDMAQNEISQGKDEQMKSKAQEIINKQKDEQQKLRDFVGSYKPSGMKHAEGELQKSMSKAMGQMETMQMTGDTDKDFATMMTHHHEHGIEMSKMELTNGMSDKLKKMAQKSIDDQQKDIKEFKSWLNNHK
jgi:uncharacterized protein (DUF305 family)